MKNYFYKKKISAVFLLLSNLLLLNSCFSVPIREISHVDNNREIKDIGSLNISGCEKKFFNQCSFKYSELLRDLKGTGLFTKISFDENNSADYVMTIESYHRNRYGIGHNPAFFVLSTIIPFWEKIEYGYNFTIKDIHKGKIYKINTKEKGINIMWSGSILINILPTSGLPITSNKNEIIYLRNTIINKLK